VGAVVCVHAKDMKEPWCLATSERECVREDVLSARCKSAPGRVARPAIEGNCVAAMRGGEQPEVDRQSVG
jgi:hypothetical protein